MKVWQMMIVLVCAAGLGLWSMGCSQSGDNENADDGNENSVVDENGNENADTENENGDDGLTEREQQAVVVATQAPSSLGSGATVSQSSTSDSDDEQNERAIHQATFGTCPEVTKDGIVLSDEGATLTIDFGEALCTVFSTEEGDTYECMGSASGNISLDATLTSGGLALSFNDITCSEEMLTGTAALEYALGFNSLTMIGDWDLSYTPGAEAASFGTTGSGTIAYEVALSGCCDVISIDTFTGQATEGDDEWLLEMDGILMSVEEYYSLIPYAGTLVVDGPDIRQLTITFNENSPVTGEVTIQIENGRTFTVDYEDLEAWAELILGEVE